MELNKDVFWRLYSYKREDNAWDYKQHLSISTKNERYEFAKDLLAFANFGGGYMLLGVEDKTHLLTGVDSKIDPSSLGDLIEKRLGVNLDVQFFYFDHLENAEKKVLGLVWIPPGNKVEMSNYDLRNSDGKIKIQANSIYYRRNTRSIRANGEDIEKIHKRLYNKQSENVVSIQDETSALHKNHQSKFDFLSVLYNNYDPTAEELGKKLKEIWQFTSKRSKIDFARLIQIQPEDIDSFFDGKKLLSTSQLITITKIQKLPTDYFFKPTYNMRFTYWKEDLVKYSILSLVKPKSAICLIDNKGKFYAEVLSTLAKGICRLHDLLYSEDSQPNPALGDNNKKTPWFFNEPLPEMLQSDLSKQYYKLLEQYPRNTKRSLMQHEKILRNWFFSGDEYIARLIIEGIDSIIIKSEDKYQIKLRFMKDLLNKKVRMRGYDSINLRMKK